MKTQLCFHRPIRKKGAQNNDRTSVKPKLLDTAAFIGYVAIKMQYSRHGALPCTVPEPLSDIFFRPPVNFP